MCSLKHNPSKPHCFLSQCSLNLEASRTNVSEETPGDCVSVHAPGPPQETLQREGTRTSQLAKPFPNLDDAGPVVHHLVGFPVAASCDTAWDQTRICSNTASTVMQGLRPLCHSGGSRYAFLNVGGCIQATKLL